MGRWDKEAAISEHHEHQLRAPYDKEPPSKNTMSISCLGPGTQSLPRASIMSISCLGPGTKPAVSKHQEHQLESAVGALGQGARHQRASGASDAQAVL